jgi:hypothetical protein
MWYQFIICSLVFTMQRLSRYRLRDTRYQTTALPKQRQPQTRFSFVYKVYG